MPTQRPIFLFAFANDAGYRLQLEKEERAIRNVLTGLDRQKRIEYKSIGQINLDDLHNTFNDYHEQIFLFHYGGHSSSKFLHLDGQNARSEQLATLIGQQPLKLVFLNGCANRAQVSALFDRGVPAVIATSAVIDDGLSISLAEQFYRAFAGGKSIRQAFDAAVAYVQQIKPELEIRYRGLNLPGSDKKEFPWGLYAKDDSILDSTIHTIRSAPQFDLLAQLREASQKRHRTFSSPGGRFQHLKIEEAILTGMKDRKQKDGALIEGNISLDGKIQSLLQGLSSLWNEACSHAMVVGPGGMGKTVSLLRIWEELAKGDHLQSPVPIFIQLNEFNNRPEKNFIHNYIREHYADLPLDELLKTPQLPADGQAQPSLLLLLDGLNEVTASSNELLLEINRLRVREDYPGVQLVLSSRVDLRASYQWQSFHLLELHPLRDEQINGYLNQELPTNPRLLEVLRNPMMLSLYAAQSELPKHYHDRGLLRERVTSTGELLANVEAIQRIKMEEQNASAPSAQALRRFVLEHLLPYLGWTMQQAGAFSIEEESKEGFPGLLPLLSNISEQLLKREFFLVFKDFRKLDRSMLQHTDWKLLEELIDKICCQELTMLVSENNSYRFLHQNFRDYFAARHVQNQTRLTLYQGVIPELLRQAPLEFYVRQILGELEGEHYNKPVYLTKERRWSIAHFKTDNYLTPVLDLCRGIFEPEQLGYTVWNILSIWNEQRGELSGADLRRLNFLGFSFNGLRSSRPGLPACLSGGILKGENLFPQGHSSRVLSTVYSPDGRRIVTGSRDETAKVWDAQTGQCLLTLQGHSSEVRSTVYSPDGGRIVTASGDGTAKVWDAQTGQCLLTLYGHLGRVNSTAYSPNGERIITASEDHTAKVWDAQTGQCLLTLYGHSAEVNSTAYSPDGGRIVTGSDEETAMVWDAQTGQCLLTLHGHSREIGSTAYSPDGGRIITASADCTAKVWDAQTGQCLLTLQGHSSEVRSTVYSPDGGHIVTGSLDTTAKIWDAQTGRCLLALQGHSHWVNSTVYSPDGLRIITASADGTAKVWDAQTGQRILTLKGPSDGVKNTAYSPDGGRILTGSLDNTTNVWDAQTGQCLLTLQGPSHGVFNSAYSTDGERILTASLDGTAKIWDTQTGQRLLTLQELSSHWVNSMAYSPDRERIATVSLDHTTKVWDTQTGQCLLTLQDHSHSVLSTAYSPDGRRIVTGSWDKTAKIWDAQTGKCLLTIQGHSRGIESTAYSPDGGRILTGSLDHTAKVWDAQTGQCLITLQGHSNPVNSTAFSLDGGRIVTGSLDCTAKVWDAQTGQCLLTLQGHSGRVNSTAFSPDGGRIVTGSLDRTAKVWDAQTGQCLLTLPNFSGLLIQGCDFRELHPDSELSAEAVALLRQYGGIFDEEDERCWVELMEKNFGIVL